MEWQGNCYKDHTNSNFRPVQTCGVCNIISFYFDQITIFSFWTLDKLLFISQKAACWIFLVLKNSSNESRSKYLIDMILQRPQQKAEFGPESELRIWRFIFENEYIFIVLFLWTDLEVYCTLIYLKRLCK